MVSRIHARTEEFAQVLLSFEANSGSVRWTGDAIYNARLIGVAPKGLEAQRVGFRTAKAESGHQM
jgi:hypothetical protein